MTPMYFKLHDQTYRVVNKTYYQKKFKEGYAYLLNDINDYVYPYLGEISDVDEAISVGIYLLDNKYPYVVRPKTPEEKAIYNKSRVISLTPDCVFRNLNDMDIDPSIEEEIVTDGDIFKPSLKTTDDLMLAGMKYAIGQKNINFNQYGHKFSETSVKNNSRRSLIVGNSLKCDMADRFSQVFDINYAILFYDSLGCRNPMDPNYKTAYVIFNNEPLDFTDPDMNFVEIQRP